MFIFFQLGRQRHKIGKICSKRVIQLDVEQAMNICIVKAGSDYLLLAYLYPNAHALAGTPNNPSIALKTLGKVAEDWVNVGIIP